MGACLPGTLVFFLIGGTSSPLGLAPAAAPFGGTGVLGGLGLGLGLGRVEGGGAGAAGVSEWFSVFSTNEKVNRGRLMQTHTIYTEAARHAVTVRHTCGCLALGNRGEVQYQRAVLEVRTKAKATPRCAVQVHASLQRYLRVALVTLVKLC